jgi:hypothetical protein
MADADLLELISLEKPGRRIEVRVRDLGDFEVANVVPGKPGSHFEQVMAGPPEESAAVLQSVVDFVKDLIGERIELGWNAGMLHDGRRLLRTGDLDASARSHLQLVISWRGSHNWSKSG